MEVGERERERRRAVYLTPPDLLVSSLLTDSMWGLVLCIYVDTVQSIMFVCKVNISIISYKVVHLHAG